MTRVSLLNNKNAQRGAEKREGRISLRVLPADKAKWESKAKQNNLTLVAWIENTLNAAIEGEETNQ